MSADWPIVRINEIKADSKGSIAIGPFGSRMKSDCYVDDGVPVIRGTNLAEGPTFKGDFVYITEEKAGTLGSSNVYQYDLVFPHRGSIGEVGIILDDERYILSSSMMKLTCDRSKVNPKFLYCFFKSRIGRHELLKNASQVGTPGIGQPLTSLKGIEFRLPPLHIQDRIEEIITSLDNKIELNRQTNQTLEHIAQAIFKSWFVDFEPTRAKLKAKQEWAKRSLAAKAGGNDEQAAANFVERAAMAAISGKTLAEIEQLEVQGRTTQGAASAATFEQLKATAALFPDALVDSELGEIPEGWEVTRLGEVTTELRRGISPKYTETKGIQVINQKCIRNHTINFELTRLNDTGKRKIVGREVELGDILVNSTGVGTLGRLAPVRHLPEPTTFDSHVTVVRADADNISKAFLCGLMLEKEKYIEASGAGSTGQTELRKQVLEDINLARPPIELGELFESIVGPMNKQITNFEYQQKSLSSTRDILLPKLLSGDLLESHQK